LFTEVTRLLSLGSHEVPNVHSEVEHWVELLNHIMDASMHIRKDKPPLTWSATSFLQRAMMCTANQGGHFEQLLH